MNRQSISKAQNSNNTSLLAAPDVLQHKINRNNFETQTVDTGSTSEQYIDEPNHSEVGPRFNHDFSRIPVRLKSSYPIQAKLKIGQPNDKYEQEADRVAEQVMRMPEPRLSSSVGDSSLANSMIPSRGTIQRTCTSCSSEYKTAEDENRPVQPANLCPKCRTEEQGLIQSKRITPLIQRQEDLSEEDDEEIIQAKTIGGITPEVTPAISTGIQSLQGGG